MHCLFSGEVLDCHWDCRFPCHLLPSHHLLSSSKLQFLVLSLNSLPGTFFLIYPWHFSNLTLIGQQSSQVIKRQLPPSAPAPSLLPFLWQKCFEGQQKGGNKGKDDTQLGESQRTGSTYTGHSSHVPPQKAEPSYRWVAFPPTLPRTSWFILSSPPTQLSPHFILQST